MFNDQDGDAHPVDFPDSLDDFLQKHRIHSCCRFIKKNHLRIRNERPPQFQELQLSSRKVGRRFMLQQVQFQKLEDCFCLLPENGFLLPDRLVPQPVVPESFPQLIPRDHHQVFQHRHSGKRPGNLERPDDSKVKGLIRPLPGNFVTVKHNPAAARGDIPRDHVEHGGFACTVRSDQSGDRTLFNGKTGL